MCNISRIQRIRKEDRRETRHIRESANQTVIMVLPCNGDGRDTIPKERVEGTHHIIEEGEEYR